MHLLPENIHDSLNYMGFSWFKTPLISLSHLVSQKA